MIVPNARMEYDGVLLPPPLAALAPNGSLHIVDFGQQERLPGWFGRLLKAWLTRFHVTPRANLHDDEMDEMDDVEVEVEQTSKPKRRGTRPKRLVRRR